jgi:uncharacterized protein YfaS (alpha-2-macroglobulin family)
VMDRIAELFAHADRTSTQEQAWLLMAAEAAGRLSGGKMTTVTDAAPPQTRSEPLYYRRALGAGAPPQSVTNRGSAPAWRTVSITGVPKADLPAESSGYSISRSIFLQDGSPADLTKARQTDQFVVVISGKRVDAARAARALVVDLLPAGFEIEAVLDGDAATARYSWLKKPTATAYSEARDDRFIAALDLSENSADFTLAYAVRAVTPGTFNYPALVVEDMYEPETRGRTAVASLTVQTR